ncbi:cobalamin biosynthesis protein CbiD [Geovibrio thiophilus]|uniref:Cobalt-precorrin-5B C(1)-methyltransferase n=1 Tax=Geovibrio thiophilus TaxID=139438 RepID=A0A410JZJ1_9BACT|nr:cobalt-precorrin-5B (C(1))-methyltransferase CbiD [Geovibrio thiophilus]QAR33438.1 cobalamin biosynthesis protein CbiD [Geovibrio thiophilus]
MRKGFTTGTAAAAAAKAHAVYIMSGTAADHTDVVLPDGSRMCIPVSCSAEGAFAVKDSGDDPDVTHKAEIHASVQVNSGGRIEILGGRGVGRVTKAGLQIPVGEAAINPVPRMMIEQNVREIIGKANGAIITISVPDGERLAALTFNERIGIIGGISIIGTTGIVHPMSVDALVDSFKCEIDVKLAENRHIALVAGKIGEKHLQSIHTDAEAVMVSNYFGEAFSYLRSKGISEITLAGHPGKLAKLAMGHYNTHSGVSPQAQGFVGEALGLHRDFNTVEEICLTHPEGFGRIAELISGRVRADFGFHKTDVLLFNMKGDLIGVYNA